eukprot:SAG31_NODE_13_length_37961_cov_21.751307_20_plen_105_part_00
MRHHIPAGRCLHAMNRHPELHIAAGYLVGTLPGTVPPAYASVNLKILCKQDGVLTFYGKTCTLRGNLRDANRPPRRRGATNACRATISLLRVLRRCETRPAAVG